MKANDIINELYTNNNLKYVTVKHPVVATERQARSQIRKFGAINYMDFSVDDKHTLFQYTNPSEKIIVTAVCAERSTSDPKRLRTYRAEDHMDSEEITDKTRIQEVQKAIKSAILRDGAELTAVYLVDSENAANELINQFKVRPTKTRVNMDGRVFSARDIKGKDFKATIIILD